MSHSSEGTGPELAAVDIIVFTVFADWGQEAAAPNLHKYYLVKPAAKKGVDLGDITQERVRALARSRRHAGMFNLLLYALQVGGSRSAFYGRVSVSSFAALHDIIRECRLAFQPSSSALDEPSGGTVAYGLGLVTQEAWRHPEVRTICNVLSLSFHTRGLLVPTGQWFGLCFVSRRARTRPRHAAPAREAGHVRHGSW